MGASCHCLNVPVNQKDEFVIGYGVYSFKKAVCCKKIITIIINNKNININLLQFVPQTESENKYYGKDDLFDKNIKDKINRTDSLVRQGIVDYNNGTVRVIIPYLEYKN